MEKMRYHTEPILMRPLCWMKMVSLVRFPWMMGGLQACKKLSADRICVHQRFQAWQRTHDSVGWAPRGC